MGFLSDGFKYKIPIIINANQFVKIKYYTPWLFIFDHTFNQILTTDNGPLDADGARSSLNGGGDVRFSSDEFGNNRISCDIRKWVINNNPLNGECEVVVKIDTLEFTGSTTIYLWWGKSNQTQPEVNEPYGQYSTYIGYSFVSIDGGANDRTSFQNNGIITGSIVNGNSNGIIGNSTTYDGNSYVTLPDFISDKLEIEIFLKRTSNFLNNANIIDSETFSLFYNTSHVINWSILEYDQEDGVNILQNLIGGVTPINEWRFINSSYITRTYSLQTLAENNIIVSQRGATEDSYMNNNNQPIIIGDGFIGEIDEIRIEPYGSYIDQFRLLNYYNRFNLNDLIMWGGIVETISGDSQIVFTNNSTMKGIGNLNANIELNFNKNTILSAIIPIESNIEFNFLSNTKLNTNVPIGGNSNILFDSNSLLHRTELISGNSNILFDSNSLLHRTELISGNSNILFDSKSILYSEGIISGGSTINFYDNSILTGIGNFVGDSSINFSDNINLTGIANINATNNKILFSENGFLIGGSFIIGSMEFGFTPNGQIFGYEQKYSIEIIDVSNINLNDGQIIINMLNGNELYKYSIDNENYQTDSTFKYLSIGTYDINIKNNNTGIINTIENIEIGVESVTTIDKPTIYDLIIINNSTPLTQNGSIRILVSGGTSPYMYSLNNDMFQTNNKFDGLSEGIYSITVKDSLNNINKLSGIKITTQSIIKGSGGNKFIAPNKAKIKISNIKTSKLDGNNISVNVF